MAATPQRRRPTDGKLPSHASLMTHNQKIELDSIQKERNRLKKILKEIGGIEIHKPNIGSNLNDMTFFENSNSEDKVSNLELEHHIECSNLKNLDDNKLKWKLKGFQLISLLMIFWDIIVGFVAAKLM
ncbi:hypothetical protein H5410_013684 [Solanum commersonii]|uniref:Uncharacterized protein n=1 Tax=Solanum commersonii TaxID=4109 RepID=A0A9J5ZP42_SOLCO|nr:hypothetical protein H5410_013684 [Solanum commersonii]